MSDTTWRLVTVNTAPERAKRLIGRVAEDLKDQYTIVHVANAECKFGNQCVSSRPFEAVHNPKKRNTTRPIQSSPVQSAMHCLRNSYASSQLTHAMPQR